MRPDHRRPVFIGGTNGSGTRVYAEALELAGIFQGRTKNFAFEPEDIIEFTRPLVPQLIPITRAAVYDVQALPTAIRTTMEGWIESFGRKIVEECPDGFPRWGWKHPRNMFLVPLLCSVYPECHFVHVVRDGRDMVLADMKGDTRLFHDLLLGSGVREPTLPDCITYWSEVNVSVRRWCLETMPARYVTTRLEDLCADPAGEIARIGRLVGLEGPLVSAADLGFVSPPASLGRWKTLESDMRDTLERVGRSGLATFGYL